MNADRVAVSTAERAASGAALGTVIINLQQTQHDETSSLRIFERLDTVLVALAEALSVPPSAYAAPETLTPSVPRETMEAAVFSVSYDADGKRIVDGAQRRTLDLREGARVRVTAGMYEGNEGMVTGRQREGHFKVTLQHQVKGGQLRAAVCTVLGVWFVEAAVAGTLERLPVVSI
jgi:hypothetical protein